MIGYIDIFSEDTNSVFNLGSATRSSGAFIHTWLSFIRNYSEYRN
jgi:hypothetical protein